MSVTIDGTNGITSSGDLSLNNGAADGAQVKLSSSGYSDWNLDNYSGSFRAYYNATEYFKVTSAGLMQFNSGYGSVATAYGCRAWVNFNGTGTVAIRASGNVTSITDSGTGQYIVNFTNSMPDTNYCAVVNTRRSDGGGTADPNVGCSVKSGTTYPLSTSACPVVTGSANDGVARDFDYCAVSVFR